MTNSKVNEELNKLESNGEIHYWEKHRNRNIWLVRENEGDTGMIMLKGKVEDYITMMK